MGEARDYWLEHKDGLLALHFTLPFAQPVLAEAKGFSFAVYDPEYFIAFELEGAEAVMLGAGAPKGCSVRLAAARAETGRRNRAGGAAGADRAAFADGLKMISVECRGP